jgi:tetratricopeptide (TPR) repeat protein
MTPASVDDTCPGEEDIAAFLRGGLAQPRVHALELHTAGCSDCRRLLSALARAVALASQPGHDSVSPTIPRDPGGDGSELSSGARVGRYIVLEWLGAGGMGVVYAAYDTELDRKVALKLLRNAGAGPGDGAPIRDRLVREAQAMARLAHPNVVTVFDVGSVDDRVFIAMELVDGLTLAEWLAAERRAQGEIIAVLVAAGNGLAAAHAAGLIHRDFKPDNVLIGGDGRVRVTDFGLARLAPRDLAGDAPGTELQRSDSATRTGLVGTLAYMAPEQYLGRAVDARADQFSFAVAAYEALHGERPFAPALADPEAQTGRILRPPPHGSRVPAELREPLLRALSSAPDDRYPSMAELLAALEPRSRPRRGKAIALSAIALVAIAIAASGAYAIHLRRAAEQRTELVGRLRAMAPELRTRLQDAHMLPLHDIRGAREQVRSAIRDLERQREAPEGETERALFDFVIGEGYLALGDHERAAALLEAAWRGGERGPDIEAALGHALGTVYEHRLVQIERTVPESRRAAPVHEIEERYRGPAMAHLRAALTGRSRPPAYLEALIAYHDRRFAEASQRAHAVFAELPMFYEAGVLEAKARHEAASKLLQADRRSEATEAFAEARRVFGRVLEIARSDDQVWLDYGELVYAEAIALAQGDLPAELRREAITAFATVRVIHPDRWEPYLSEAELHTGEGNTAIIEYRDPGPHVDKVLELAEQARARGADSDGVDVLVCLSNWQRGVYQGSHGGDPRHAFEQGVAACERAVAINPWSDNHESLAVVYGAVAAYEGDHGGDPTPFVERSERSVRAGMAIDDHPAGHFSLGRLWTRQAQYLVNHGMDPHEMVDKAVAEFTTVARMAAERADAWAGASEALIARARFQWEHGDDFEPTARQARASLDRALAMAPTTMQTIKYRIMLAELDAESRLARGADPTSAVDQMRADTQVVLSRLPAASWAHRLRCRAELIAARWALARRRPVDGLLARAQAAAAQARERDAMDAWAWTASAEVDAVRVEVSLARGLPASAALASGLAFVERAMKIDAKLVRALRVRERLERAAGAAARAGTRSAGPSSPTAR